LDRGTPAESRLASFARTSRRAPRALAPSREDGHVRANRRGGRPRRRRVGTEGTGRKVSTLDQRAGSSSPEPVIQTITVKPRLRRSPEGARLERRARLLAWGGIAYHFVEFAIAI